MLSLSLTSKDLSAVSCDALVVAVAAGKDGQGRILVSSAVSKGLAKSLTAMLKPLGVSGAADQVVRVPSPEGVKADVVALVGVGSVDGDTPGVSPADCEALRRAAGAATRQLSGLKKIAFAFPADDVEHVAAVAEGAALGAYTFTEHKSAGPKPEQAPPAEAVVVTKLNSSGDAKKAVSFAQELGRAVAETRDLVNEPPSHLYPESFAQIASEKGKEAGLKVTVLDDKQLAKNGYGGLTAVGMGSARGPRLVKLEYSGKGAKKHVAIVGKGVTFDTGGISLKPAAGMETMKSDMAGAAAVLGTILLAARAGAKVKFTAYLCLAENMPSSRAQRPSDIITIFGGKTVEVLNTDAEGRLVMADGLVAASKDNPDVVMDIATLTGAQVVALGKRVSAVMGDEEVRTTVAAAATSCGEQFWPMPLPTEMRAKIDSPVADLKNIGDRWGGMLSAGLFLREFVGKVGGDKAADDAKQIPWAHLDIAGPSYNDEAPHGYTPKGGTGVAVRTLYATLLAYSS